MVSYRNKENGLIYTVSNPDLIAIYDADAKFERIEEKKPAKKETKK